MMATETKKFLSIFLLRVSTKYAIGIEWDFADSVGDFIAELVFQEGENNSSPTRS